jgi:hypothetical protein
MSAHHLNPAAPLSPYDWRELAARDSDGVAVSLLWSRAADRVRVVVTDSRLGTELDFDVAGADALAAFHHPYAYAAALGRPFDEPASSLDLQPQS